MMALILAYRPEGPLGQLIQLRFRRVLAISGRPVFRNTPKVIAMAELSTSGSPPLSSGEPPGSRATIVLPSSLGAPVSIKHSLGTPCTSRG